MAVRLDRKHLDLGSIPQLIGGNCGTIAVGGRIPPEFQSQSDLNCGPILRPDQSQRDWNHPAQGCPLGLPWETSPPCINPERVESIRAIATKVSAPIDDLPSSGLVDWGCLTPGSRTMRQPGAG